MRVRAQSHAASALPSGRNLLPNVQEVGLVAGPVWTGAENLTPTRIQSSDHPACSELLYGLCYTLSRKSTSTAAKSHNLLQTDTYLLCQLHAAGLFREACSCSSGT